jgi:nucleoside-diphosphate-sugar epimerase/MoaA/NifB/PqqE/SkfB family radical SAM enzyme
MSTKGVVALLGATGRLGPAVVRALRAAGWEVRGLSRRAAPGVVVAERADAAALARVVGGARAVVDLLGFDEAGAQTLLAVIDEAGEAGEAAPGHLIFASSIAESGPRWLGAGESAPCEPGDAYGRGKLAARRAYQHGFRGRFHALVLPRLVAPEDPARREQPYLDAAADGVVLHAGDGTQRQSIAPVEGVAAVVARLVEAPDAVPPGRLNVGPPAPTAVGDAIAALLEGAGLRARLARHPDRAWRGPHGPVDEILDTSRLQSLLPGLEWPDVRAVHRQLGAWLASHPPAPTTARRPLRLVSKQHHAEVERRVVDVHALRPCALAAPSPALAELAGWLAPAFYLDVGRPCNSACLYCAVPPHLDTHGFTPLSRLADAIRAGAAAGCDRAIFIGGEPSIYPELDGALRLLDQQGLPRRHVIMTNGLRLADAGFVERLAAAGVATVHLSIDTADGAISERLSRSRGQLPRQLAALDNILGTPGLRAYVYACVTRLNAGGVPDLLRLVARRAAPPPPVVLAFVKPVGDALAHASELALGPAERARIARDAARVAGDLGVTLGLRNLQACLAPELLPFLVDYYLEDYSIEVATRAREPYAHREYLAPVEACSTCAHHELCPGVYREDAARFGGAAYRALDRQGLALSRGRTGAPKASG